MIIAYYDNLWLALTSHVTLHWFSVSLQAHQNTHYAKGQKYVDSLS